MLEIFKPWSDQGDALREFVSDLRIELSSMFAQYKGQSDLVIICLTSDCRK